MKYNKKFDYLILSLVMLLGLGLRLRGLHFGLPHLFARPDEQSLVRISFDLFSGDLNPHFFQYPSLFIYLVFFSYKLYYLLGSISGHFADQASFMVSFVTDPSPFFLIPRYLSVLSSLACVLVIYRIGLRFFSKQCAVIAAMFTAVAFIMVREAHFGVTDSTMTFLCTLTVYYALAIYQYGRKRDFIFAAIAAGLAASTKYPAALLLMPLGTAILFRFVEEKRLKYFYRDRRLWLLIIVGLTSFIAVSPYLVIDYQKFYEDFSFMLYHTATAYSETSFGYWYHLNFTLRYGLGWPLLLLSLVSIIYQGWQRNRKALIILSFILGFFLIMGGTKRPFVRYLLPIIPLMMVLAAETLAKINNLMIKGNEQARLAATVIAALLIALPPLNSSLRFTSLMEKPDTRVLATRWIEENLPAGAILAVDGLFYNNLPLVESPAQTRARLERFMPRLFDSRLKDNYQRAFGRPWYQVYFISDFYSTTINVSAAQQSSKPEASKLLRTIKGLGVRYLVTSSYKYLSLYSDNWVRLKPALAGKTRLIKQINPYNENYNKTPEFDQIDALFIPYNGFNAVTNPGPQINILEIL